MNNCPMCGAATLANETRCKSCKADLTQAKAMAATASMPRPAEYLPAGSNRTALPFVPVIKPGTNEATQCAEQLTTLIRSMESKGWSFCHLEDVTTLHDNGCLAGLFGPRQTVLSVQVAIFEWVR